MLDLKVKRQQLLSFLLRCGRNYPDGKNWTKMHARWLAAQKFGRQKRLWRRGAPGAPAARGRAHPRRPYPPSGRRQPRNQNGLLGTLRRQEVHRIGRGLAAEHGRTFHAIQNGETVRGKLIGSTQLASGRFAMIDNGLGFSLVPWRPVLEDHIGRQVFGVMRGADISWQLGRPLGLALACSRVPDGCGVDSLGPRKSV